MIRARRVALRVLVGALLAAGATAADGGDSRGAAAARWLGGSRLADDPGGARRWLEGLGIDLQLFYNQVLAWKPAGGGVDRDDETGHSGSYDLFGLVDLEELAGVPGIDALVHVKGQYDRNLNLDVGALSDPIDDADDFDEPIYVDELWLQGRFADDRLRLRVGLLEQQTVFERNAYANSEDRQFLATFLDNDPLVPLPNGLGAVLIARPVPGIELAAGVVDADKEPRQAGFDTAFDNLGSLSVHLEASVALRLSQASRAHPGALRLGAYRDGRERVDFDDGDGDRGHYGVYMNFDLPLFREDATRDEGLGILGRFGWADEDVSAIEWFWSAGFQYAGPLPGRSRDVLGVASYQAIGSDALREARGGDVGCETGIEVYYSAALLPWLALTADLQYLIDPGIVRRAADVWVGALRLRVSF